MSSFEKINKNVLICGIVKNCKSQIILNIQYALKTLELFNQSKIIIYENNSTDGTKDILNDYSKINFLQEKIKIISEDIDLNQNNCIVWSYKEITGSDHPCRIELISKARNTIIEEFNKIEYDDYEYILWIDLDSNGWEIDGIINSFSRNEKWDVLLGNSENNHYDYYALRYKEFLFGPEIIGEEFWSNRNDINFNNRDDLIPVYSAFNGMGIYKKELFKKFKYDFLVNDEVKKFYRNIIKYNISEKKIGDDTMKLIVNKCSNFPNGYKDEETDIFWKSNSGYDTPIVCEHVALNLTLFNNGYKLYVNPKMIYHR